VNEQADLFDTAPGAGSPGAAYARNTDPGPSHAAAEAVDATKLEALTLAVLRRFPCGLTSFEIAEILGLEWSSISPRMKPLEERGLVVRTAERRNKRTVWVARADALAVG
jgi:DNA-binding MarR family transcriptional regulator